MTVYELMVKLGSAGIKLWVESGQLKFKAPKGALTAELKQQLVQMKPDVIEFLQAAKSQGAQGKTIPVIDREQPIQLSFAQQRLWFIEQLAPGTSTFHISAALKITGPLNLEAMEKAFSQLIQRHEVLRTSFVTQDEEAFQFIHEAQSFQIPVMDLTSQSYSAALDQAQQLIQQETLKPFDLTEAPLLRASIYLLGENQHAMVIVIHHIVTDGWSMGIFVKELVALYGAASSGFAISLPELPIQYADFSVWQRGWLAGEELERQLKYWRKELANCPRRLALPTDFNPPELLTNNGAVAQVRIDEHLTVNVRELARVHECTTYVIFMAAYKILLARWCKQQDLCIGMPIAGRTQSQTEPLIGFFVNQLVIRTTQCTGLPLGQFISEVKEKVLSAQSHQDVPFEAIVEALEIPRELDHSPLFQAALSLTSADSNPKSINIAGISMQPLEVELVAARLEMTMMLVDHGDEVTGMLEFNADLFSPDTMVGFCQQFCSVLENICAQPEAVIGNVGLSTSMATASVPPLQYLGRYQLDPEEYSIYSMALAPTKDPSQLKQSHQVLLDQQPILRAGWRRGGQQFSGPDETLVFDYSTEVIELNLAEESATDEALIRAVNNCSQAKQLTTLINHFLVKDNQGKHTYVLHAHPAVLDAASAAHLMSALVDGQEQVRSSRSVSDIQNCITNNNTRLDQPTTLDRIQQWLLEMEPMTCSQEAGNTNSVLTCAFGPDLINALVVWCREQSTDLQTLFQTLFEYSVLSSHYSSKGALFVASEAISHSHVTAAESNVLLGNNSALCCVHPKLERSPHFLTRQSLASLMDENWLLASSDLSWLKAVETTAVFNQGTHLNCIQAPSLDSYGQHLWVSAMGEGVVLSLAIRGQADVDLELLNRIRFWCEALLAGAPLTGLSTLFMPQEQQRLQQLNGLVEKPAADSSVVQQFLQAATEVGDKPAVICGDHQLSYTEFAALTLSVAQQLASLLGGSRTAVAICVGRSVYLPAIYWGAMRAGCPYVPMDIDYPDGRLVHIINDSKAKVILADELTLARLEQLMPEFSSGPQLVSLAQIIEPAPDLQLPRVELEDLLYYVYTSGSTGKPKGAGVFHSGEANLVNWYRQAVALKAGQRVLLMSAMGFDLTQKNLIATICSGATLVVPPFNEFDPEATKSLLKQHQIQVINCAPSAFYPLLEEADHAEALTSLEYLVLGGEPIQYSRLAAWLDQDDCHCVLINSYGPTECTDVVASQVVNTALGASSELPIGQPIPNVTLYVVNEEAVLLRPGAVGEIVVGGVGVGQGYLGRPELTAEVFNTNPFMEDTTWYFTGDLGYLDHDNRLVYKGRKDFQLKLRGLRIEPGEINAIVRAQVGIRDVNTLVVADRLVTFVLANEEFVLDRTFAALRKELPSFMVPAQIVTLASWPLTPNGKLDRDRLTQQADQSQQALVAPRDGVESQLLAVWCEVLKREAISVTANFFEQGGHSLLATQVISRARKLFQVELSVRHLFTAPTIRELAKVISALANSNSGFNDIALQPCDPPNRTILSFAQHRLWFVDQLNQGSSEYNLPHAIAITGKLDIKTLDLVFAEIVRRHEVLKTRFSADQGVPRLIVDEVETWQSNCTDLSSLDQVKQQQEVSRLVDADAARVYSLENDSLFSTHIITLGDDRYVLLLNMHHIVSDGWSMGILAAEIQALYPALRHNRPSPLPELEVQYSDFAHWQRQWLNEERLTSLTDYWQQALAGAPDRVRLPTDRPRPEQQTFNGAHFELDLGVELSKAVDTSCIAQDLTPFMVLIGAYQVLLARYSGQNDICVGVPIAGRNRLETESMIGFFINGLIIRGQMGENLSVAELLQQLKDTTLGAYAHQDMPADVLLDRLKLERSADASPGAQVGFALQNLDFANFKADLPGLTLENYPREHKTAKYEISLILMEQGERYHGVIEYNTDLFDETTIARMATHYSRLVQQITADPAQSLADLQLVQNSDLPGLLNVDARPQDLYPLTPMQRDMVLDTQLNPQSLQNSLGYQLIIEQPFDLARWQQALQTLVDEEPVLRSKICLSSYGFTEVAYRWEVPTCPVEVQVHDWRQQATSSQQARAEAQRVIWQPYELEGPLAFYDLYQLDQGRTMVVVRMNHIIMDGAALAIHLKKALEIYQTTAGAPSLAKGESLFNQYLQDCRAKIDRPSVLEFWRAQGAQLEALEFSVPQGQSEQGRIERSLQLSSQHWQDIQAFCKARKTTPSTYFKALYSILVAAYCRPESDFCLLEVTAGRIGQYRRAMGNFFQIVPLVFSQQWLTGESRFIDLLQHIRQFRKSLKSNAQLSLHGLGRVLPQSRLQFMFNYYDFIPGVELNGEPLALTAYPQIQDGPVQFVAEELKDSVQLHLIYLAERFADLQFLERMVQLSEQLLNGDQQLGALELRLPKERTEPRTQSVAATQAEEVSEQSESSTVIAGFSQQAEKTPQNIAIIQGDRRLSYHELNLASSRLAERLMSLGVQRGDQVVICLSPSPDMLVAVLAALKLGAVYIPLAANYPTARLDYVLQDAQAKVLLSETPILNRLQQSIAANEQLAVLNLCDTGSEATNPDDADASKPVREFVGPDPTDGIYTIYTSGSTGQPKGVRINHAAESRLQHWFLSTTELAAKDRLLLISAFGFDLTQKNLFAPLLVGASLVIPDTDEFDLELLKQTIQQHEISVINCAPSQIYPLVESATEHSFPSLRVLMLGGEPIRLGRLSPWWQQSNCRLINSYGPTECTDVVAWHEVNKQAAPDAPIPLGQPITSAALYVVDGVGRRLPAGIEGELYIGGPQVGAGYWNKPELTQAAFQDNPYAEGRWYSTGDLVKQNVAGDIEFIGRKDFQVKLRGLRIELAEIEFQLQQIPLVLDSLTLVKDDRLVSYLLCNEPVDLNGVKATLRRHVPDYMVPSGFVCLTQWPLSANGKIDRAQLPDVEDNGRSPLVAPRNNTEAKLLAIWQEILNLEEIGVHDNFFDLGGHSLLAARAVSRFRETFDLDIQLRSLFEMQTIEDIAKYLDTVNWANQAAQEPQSSEGREEGFL